MAGMTETGFKPKRAAEILAEMRLEAAAIRDPATGEYPFMNLTDDSLVAQILGIVSQELDVCWEAAYQASSQFDPLKNFGVGQAGTVQLNSMTRLAGAPTIIRLALGGMAGALVPAGTCIANGDASVIYATREDAVIAADGAGTVTAASTTKGPYDPKPGTVFAISKPVSGLTSAANTETLSVGTYEETDKQLRARQQRSTSLTSYRQIEAVAAAVRNIPGVVFARAYQNSKHNPVDERGIPFKEVAVVAVGGDPRAIAEALFLRFPTGQVGHGNVGETFLDSQGQSYTIRFSRPDEIPVHVALDITVTDRALFPDDGAERIRQAIVAYAQNGGEGNSYGFAPGEAVVRSRLFTPVNTVAGHRIDSLKIGASPDALSESDIPVAWNQASVWDAAAITVNVTVPAGGGGL